jgi:hypothetical protein
VADPRRRHHTPNHTHNARIDDEKEQGRTGQEGGQAQGCEAAAEGCATGKQARGEDQSGQEGCGEEGGSP